MTHHDPPEIAHPRHGGEELPVTVAAYLVQWLGGRQTLRPSMRLAYEIHLRRYLIPQLGERALRELTLSDIEAAYRSIESEATPAGRPISAATMRRIHATLTCALNAAVRRGLLAHNPAAHVELRPAAFAQTQTWTAQELTRFLAGTEQHRLHPLFLTLAVTGMRRGEALGLRWIDVDLDAGLIRIRQQIVAVGARLETGPPKTHAGRRTIAIPRRLSEALRWHAARQRLDRFDAAPAWQQTGLVFTTETGRPLSPAFVSREFTRLATHLGVPVIRLHDLRHTSASLGLAAGEPLLEASRRLGHSSITITADIYSHISPAAARRSAERLAGLLTDPNPAPATATAPDRDTP